MAQSQASTDRVSAGIKHGPSMEELQDALFKHTSSTPRPVTFTLQSIVNSTWWVENYELILYIRGVTRLDLEGLIWHLEAQTEKGDLQVVTYYRPAERSGLLDIRDRGPALERAALEDLLEKPDNP